MLRNNRELARSQLRQQTGRDVDDAQLDAYLNMMNPDMIRMAMNMAKDNPNLMTSMKN